MKQNIFRHLFFGLWLFCGASNLAHADRANCTGQWRDFLNSLEQLRSAEHRPSLTSDLDFWNNLNQRGTDGAVIDHYDNKFKTRLYYNSTARPDAQGKVPTVDPEARGLYVFFHGSGTAKASGRNFIDKMKEFSSLGYSAVGFDMPFHGDGPVNSAFNDTEYFMKWLHDLVGEYRVKGKPVWFVGHSFGPDVIAEYAKRYPKDIDGGLFVSPAGFNPELAHWYENFTEKMNFGETINNDPGGEWAGKVSDAFTWKDPAKGADPTLVNPKLKIRVLTGDHEEYVPGPVEKVGNNYKVAGKNTYDVCAAMRRIFAKIDCTLEPGVGHYIFNHRGTDGANVIVREMLALDGKTPADIPALTKAYNDRVATYSPAEKFGLAYAQDPMFREWINANKGPDFAQNLITKKRNGSADGLLKEFYDENTGWIAKRFLEIDTAIRATAQTDPEFYAANKKEIDALGKKGAHLAIYSKYFKTVTSAN